MWKYIIGVNGEYTINGNILKIIICTVVYSDSAVWKVLEDHLIKYMQFVICIGNRMDLHAIKE